MAALRWLSLGPSTVSPKVKDVEKSCCFGGMRLRHRTTDPVPTQSCSVYKCTTSCFICSSSAYPWILLTFAGRRSSVGGGIYCLCCDCISKPPKLHQKKECCTEIVCSGKIFLVVVQNCTKNQVQLQLATQFVVKCGWR